MRIGIDARLYNQTGVGRYIRNLLKELQRVDTKNEYFIYVGKDQYAKLKPWNKNWHIKLLDLRWHTLKEQVIVPLKLMEDKLDVAHFPYFNVPVLYPGKYLLTIHDLIIDHFDTGQASTLNPFVYKLKRLAYKFALFSGIRRASRITVISRTTQNEIMTHYHADRKKVTVTYDSLDNDFIKIAGSTEPSNNYSFPYILYVGNAYPHKNLERLILAVKEIKRRNKDLKLILAGDDPYFYQRLKQFTAGNAMSDSVVFFGNANDKQLLNLYSFSKCLVFPSLMEGFGLPNLESLMCNTLPVVSDIPVFREIWGDDLDYFDPESHEDMADKILQTIELPRNIYNKKVQKAKDRIKQFSWRRTAEKTLEIYEDIYRR